MSAGGSMGGTDHVWIKLATAKADAFAYLTVELGELVGSLIDRACSKYTHWMLNAGQVRLFMLAKAGPKPQLPSPEALKDLETLAEEATLESAGVTSGAWLVAVPTTPGSSGGGGDDKNAINSISPRTVKSLESAHSTSREAEASAAFWTLAHAAFPGAALELVQRRLLDSDRYISNRYFKSKDFPGVFETGRDTFVAATLSAEMAPPKNIQSIDFTASGDYTSKVFEMVEADCLLKLPALVPCDWARDPAALNPPFFIAPPYLQPLPERPDPNVQVAVEAAESATRSRFSVDYYPANSAMYVLGEVYAPLGSEAPLNRTVQKLLQAERTVQFLSAKEGKPVSECILGVVFMGPHIDKDIGSKLFKSLEYYKDVLPCLWSLYGMKRLLGFHMRKPFQPAVESLLNAAAIAQLTQQMKQLAEQQKQFLAQQQQIERRWLGCSLM